MPKKSKDRSLNYMIAIVTLVIICLAQIGYLSILDERYKTFYLVKTESLQHRVEEIKNRMATVSKENYRLIAIHGANTDLKKMQDSIGELRKQESKLVAVLTELDLRNNSLQSKVNNLLKTKHLLEVDVQRLKILTTRPDRQFVYYGTHAGEKVVNRQFEIRNADSSKLPRRGDEAKAKYFVNIFRSPPNLQDSIENTPLLLGVMPPGQWISVVDTIVKSDSSVWVKYRFMRNARK